LVRQRSKGGDVIQRFKLAAPDGDDAIAVAKAVETLTMVDRAFVDMSAGELVVEGEAEREAIRDMVSAAGGRLGEQI
jgi:hypothetical protein